MTPTEIHTAVVPGRNTMESFPNESGGAELGFADLAERIRVATEHTTYMHDTKGGLIVLECDVFVCMVCCVLIVWDILLCCICVCGCVCVCVL